MPNVDEKLPVIGVVINATRDAQGNLVYLTAGAGGGGGGDVTQGTSPWVVSGPLTNAQLLAITGAVAASPDANTLLARLKDINDSLATLNVDTADLELLIGEVQDDPTPNTLLARLDAIQAELAGLLNVVPRKSDNTELFTVADPGSVQQAAPRVGQDEHAITAITPKTVNCTASGETVLVDPAAGNFVRVWYFQMSNITATAVEVSLRAGTGTANLYSTKFPAAVGALNGHNIKPNYWDLDVDQILYANLSEAADVDVTVEYEEITP